MRRTINLPILCVMLIVFVQPEGQPSLGGNSQGQRWIHMSSDRSGVESKVDSNELDGWIIECFECPNNISDASSLKVDASGFPHITYGSDYLYYTWFDGYAWQFEQVDDSPDAGSYPSLFLDGEGYAHISYLGEFIDPYFQLKYAFQDENGWQIQTLEIEGGVHRAALTLDADGYPHISYVKNDSVGYVYMDAGGWKLQPSISVSEPYFVGNLHHIELDHSGQAHMTYFVSCDDCDPFLYTSRILMYAYYENENWHIEDLDSHVPMLHSLKLDVQGEPHVAYSENGMLKYALRDSISGWGYQTADIRVRDSIALVLDAAGDPHIGYLGGEEYLPDLEYAFLDTNGWQVQTIDSGCAYDQTISMSLDELKHAHISYLCGDVFNPNLKYAHLDPNGTHLESLSQGGYVGWSSLALDEQDYPHISYTDFHSGAVTYAYQDGSGWNNQIVNRDLGRETSLALDDHAIPYISYRGSGECDFCDLVKFAYLDDSGWNIEQVSSESGVYNTSIALDRAGKPRICYGGFSLKCAEKDDGVWSIKTLGDVGVYEWISINIDDAGYPHVSYSHDNDGQSIKYSFQNEFGWQTEIVDNRWSESTSLVLDANGQALISYIRFADANNRYLNLASQENDGWNIQELRFLGDKGEYTSLALDENDFAHISYISDGLYYAYQDAEGWHFQQLDRVGAGPTSIQLGVGGNPHISYQNDGNLKLAYLPPSNQVDIWPDKVSGYKLPGETNIYSLQVSNRGREIDSYLVTSGEHSWVTQVPGNVGPLASFQSTTIDVQVTVPQTATIGSSDTVTITITSKTDSSVFTSAALTTYASRYAFLPMVAK